jgi:hypothetical protein
LRPVVLGEERAHEHLGLEDVRAHLDLRRAAMAWHASQRTPYDDMPDDLGAAFLCHDRLVRVEPPWTDGPVESALLLHVRPNSGSIAAL